MCVCVCTVLDDVDAEGTQRIVTRLAARNVAVAVIGAARHSNSKRAVEVRDALLLGLLTGKGVSVRVYTFHLLLWTSLLLVGAGLLAIYVMHSLYDETEKDALLYRNTTSTMFANALELR